MCRLNSLPSKGSLMNFVTKYCGCILSVFPNVPAAPGQACVGEDSEYFIKLNFHFDIIL